MLLARLDSHLSPQRLVLEAARNVHDHIAAWKPALAVAVDVCVGDMPHTHVAAYVYVPCVEVRVDLVVMAVRLVWDALGRPEVYAAGHRLPCVVVHDHYLHPVAPSIHQLDARPWLFPLCPCPQLLPTADARWTRHCLLYGDGRGGHRRNLGVRLGSHRRCSLPRTHGDTRSGIRRRGLSAAGTA